MSDVIIPVDAIANAGRGGKLDPELLLVQGVSIRRIFLRTMWRCLRSVNSDVVKDSCCL